MASRRPSNRKAMIRSAASELFLTRGYHNVSVTDVADALEIAPSALYHHYRNKQELLLHATLDAVESVDALVREAQTLEEALQSLARLVVAPGRSLAVWEREARHLDQEQRELIKQREADVVDHLVPLLVRSRPDLDPSTSILLAQALLGVLGSRAQHRLNQSRRRDEQLMVHLGSVIAAVRLPAPPESEPRTSVSHPPAPVAGLPPSRRDLLLSEAVRLFDERGYQSVTMADIGEAAGIVASGVYRHFPSKTDILVAAANRGGERIRIGVEVALSDAPDPEAALAALVHAHVRIVVQERHLVGILSNEADQLPVEDRRALRRFQQDYLELWLATLRAVIGNAADATELKIIIHAVHSMVYFVVRRAGDSPAPGLRDQLQILALALLLDPVR